MAISKPHYQQISPIEYLSDKVSWKTKKASNFKWIEIRAKFIDNSYPDCFSQEYKESVEDNYNLISGDKMVHFKKEARERARVRESKLRREGLDMLNTEMRHFDSLSYMVDGLGRLFLRNHSRHFD